ncbi:hypothetical protein DYD21_14065 [Rhodohalobacter sp. SW132]|nr:hypothetical protein DYD21_14065 [Rhodohalobacter sp. SW132]
MYQSNNDSYWDHNKIQTSEKETDNAEKEILRLGANDQKKIFWIQQRLNVSREEALRIYHNSLL